jgi:hypothetical protein
MNLRLLIVLALCLVSPTAIASLYRYPEDKQPQISVKQACDIAESILAKLGHGQGYFAYEVSILGDEGQTGGGAWTLMYRNTNGDKIQFGIYFPEDRCFVAVIPKNGKYSENEYTRDGRVSPQWNEWQKKLREDEEKNERFLRPADPEVSKEGTEPAGADQPDTQPADKHPVKDQPSPPTSKDAPR